MMISKRYAAAAALALALISVVGAAVAQTAPPAKKPTVRGKPIVKRSRTRQLAANWLERSEARRFGRATVSGLQKLGELRPLKKSHRHRPLPLPRKSNNMDELLPIKMAPVRGHFLDIFLSRPNDGDAS